MSFMIVTPPKPATLKKYGLSLPEWLAILNRQGGTCAVCKRIPKSGRLHTDHQHIKNWKKLPANERKKYVRGLLCFICNSRFASKGMTAEKATNLAQYLRDYETSKTSKT